MNLTEHHTRILVASTITIAASSVVLMILTATSWIHHNHRLEMFQRTNCRNIEALKAGQREEALATIAGDTAFLAAHPKGTQDFPAAVVRADIAAKQKTVDRFPPRKCE